MKGLAPQLEELKIPKAEYGKASKEPVKLTNFDPSSVKVDHPSFLDLFHRPQL